jgi:hypothetical protein
MEHNLELGISFKSEQLVDVINIVEYWIYSVSIKSFPDYKHLLQENNVEYKYIYFFVQNVAQLKKFLYRTLVHLNKNIFVFQVGFL